MPGVGSDPKKGMLHEPELLTVFSTHRRPLPNLTRWVPLTLKLLPSEAIQSQLPRPRRVASAAVVRISEEASVNVGIVSSPTSFFPPPQAESKNRATPSAMASLEELDFKNIADAPCMKINFMRLATAFWRAWDGSVSARKPTTSATRLEGV